MVQSWAAHPKQGQQPTEEAAASLSPPLDPCADLAVGHKGRRRGCQCALGQRSGRWAWRLADASRRPRRVCRDSLERSRHSGRRRGRCRVSSPSPRAAPPAAAAVKPHAVDVGGAGPPSGERERSAGAPGRGAAVTGAGAERPHRSRRQERGAMPRRGAPGRAGASGHPAAGLTSRRRAVGGLDGPGRSAGSARPAA
ncbi:unnamed protein product [Prorocentrum cordatum]|uniref:Uncharacterized protein n=1 Tax=Prorocentrum cordatum TaxID=2364126 RepID=A0ABN9W0I1_9DINO|nr:unnamed protein product [Polarella glacialis]